MSTSITREEAITNHRKMWRWIADETERRGVPVYKSVYFKEMGFRKEEIPLSLCFCCDYGEKEFGINVIDLDIEERRKLSKCTYCPLQWNGEDNRHNIFCYNDPICPSKKGLFKEWSDAVWERDISRAAEIARKIAELPEKDTNNNQ